MSVYSFPLAISFRQLDKVLAGDVGETDEARSGFNAVELGPALTVEGTGDDGAAGQSDRVRLFGNGPFGIIEQFDFEPSGFVFRIRGSGMNELAVDAGEPYDAFAARDLIEADPTLVVELSFADGSVGELDPIGFPGDATILFVEKFDFDPAE